jgi:hypothetical protein
LRVIHQVQNQIMIQGNYIYVNISHIHSGTLMRTSMVPNY